VCRALLISSEKYADLPFALLIAAQLAHSPTSLLCLPNDILLLILEEVYEERQLAITKTIPLRIAEILINKRIFSLSQPLWSKHLSISADQLDLRLSGIFDDKARRSRLRSLDIFIDNSHYNLVKSVLLRLPHLTYLALNIFHKLIPTATTVLIGIVSSLARLKHLRLRSPQVRQQIDDFWEAYLDQLPRTTISVSFECQGVVYSQEHLQTGTKLTVRSFELFSGSSGSLDASNWSTYASLTLRSYEQLLVWTDEILSGLASAIENKVCPPFSARPSGSSHSALPPAGITSRTTQAGCLLSPLQQSGTIQMFGTERLQAATPAFATHQASAASVGRPRKHSRYSN